MSPPAAAESQWRHCFSLVASFDSVRGLSVASPFWQRMNSAFPASVEWMCPFWSRNASRQQFNNRRESSVPDHRSLRSPNLCLHKRTISHRGNYCISGNGVAAGFAAHLHLFAQRSSLFPYHRQQPSFSSTSALC